jgi:xanthine/uracil permease
MVIQFKQRSLLSGGFMMRVLENVNPSCIQVVVVMIIGLKLKQIVMMFASLSPVRKNQRKAEKAKSIARIMLVGNRLIDIWLNPTYWVNKDLVSNWII